MVQIAVMIVGIVAIAYLILKRELPLELPPEPPPEEKSAFVMIGGTHREKVWTLDKATYTIEGTLKNVGSSSGTAAVVGWFKVGNYGEIHDVYQETITLAPGQTRVVSSKISRAEMEAAEAEEGYGPEYMEYLIVRISSQNHAGYASSYGELSVMDIVYVKRG